jgi:hypothetical protein
VKTSRKNSAPIGSMIVHSLPRHHMSREEWDITVGKELVELWEQSLTADERRSKSECEQDQTKPLALSVVQKLDNLIIEQARSLGSQLLQSSLVLARFKAWEDAPDGDKRIERFGKSWAQFHRIIHKRERQPIADPALHKFKIKTVEELRSVLRILRKDFSVKNRPPTTKDVTDRFRTTVDKQTQVFRRLHKNLDSWTDYLTYDRETTRHLMTGNRVGPARLFDDWYGWKTGYDPETVRQKISVLPGLAPHRSAKL